jgi:class 3 adenylate cyclase
MNALAATAQAPSPAPAQATPQLRTLLLTDLVDSTGTVERLGDAPAAELFRAHDRLVLDLQQRWRGRLIDRSDGLLLLFERAIDGLGFALDYHRGLRELGKAHGVPLQARAGLHVGEVLTWRNSAEAVAVGAKPLEVEGLAKPLAGRLLGLARPGQILLSATAEALAHRAARELGERGAQLAWKSHGRWRFKGLPEPLEVYEAGEPGLAPLQAPRPDAKAWRWSVSPSGSSPARSRRSPSPSATGWWSPTCATSPASRCWTTPCSRPSASAWSSRATSTCCPTSRPATPWRGCSARRTPRSTARSPPRSRCATVPAP